MEGRATPHELDRGAQRLRRGTQSAARRDLRKVPSCRLLDLLPKRVGHGPGLRRCQLPETTHDGVDAARDTKLSQCRCAALLRKTNQSGWQYPRSIQRTIAK